MVTVLTLGISPHPVTPSGSTWGVLSHPNRVVGRSHPGFEALTPPCASPGLSRGPSPVVLGSQDTLPVATAFTEYVHAYFKGHDADRYRGPGGALQPLHPTWGVR